MSLYKVLGKQSGKNPSYVKSFKINWISLELIDTCTIHVVTLTLISNLATDYVQKRRGEPGLFSFGYNLSPKLILT